MHSLATANALVALPALQPGKDREGEAGDTVHAMLLGSIV